MKKNIKEIRVSYIKHKTARDLVITYFRYDHPRMSVDKLLKQETEFQLEIDGEMIYPGTVKEVITVVEKSGIWAFCDKISDGKDYPIIHFWINNKARKDKIKVMEIFAHETLHAVGYQSENLAVRFGGVAAFAYISMMKEVYGQNVERKGRL